MVLWRKNYPGWRGLPYIRFRRAHAPKGASERAFESPESAVVPEIVSFCDVFSCGKPWKTRITSRSREWGIPKRQGLAFVQAPVPREVTERSYPTRLPH